MSSVGLHLLLLLPLLLLLTTQISGIFTSEESLDYDDGPLATRESPLFGNIIVYSVKPDDSQAAAQRSSRGESRGPVEEYFDQFAESVIFVKTMKTNLETTIKEAENSTHKLSFKVLLAQLRQMKYKLVDSLSKFQSYKLEFSHLYDKVFDFYMMGTATDVLTEDHFENIASCGTYSDIFYHVLRFKILRDLYSIAARETTDASWPQDLGDIPPDNVVGELSTNVMESLGNILGMSKFVEMIFGKQLPIQNGPEWDNAYPGNVFKLMTSTKYYLKSLISYKMVTTTKKIKNATVYLSENVMKVLSTMAKQRILNALMHKTLLRIFTRLKDLESFMKTGNKTAAVINKRYFDGSISVPAERSRQVDHHPSMEIDRSSPGTETRKETDSHVSKRFSKEQDQDQEWSLLQSMYQMLNSPYGTDALRKKILPPSDDTDSGNVLLKLNVVQGKVKEGPSETSIILKTPYGLRVIGKEDKEHGHFLAELHRALKETSLVVAHEISTYMGKMVTKQFIKVTFGYLGSGVNDWVKFINSGNLSGGNALIGKIVNFCSIPTLTHSISQIVKSFGLDGKFVIDKKDVHAEMKASMPMSFEGILEHLKTLNKNTSRTSIRFRNLTPIMEVVKIKMLMQKMKISNDVSDSCGRSINHKDNLYLIFQKYRRRDTKLKGAISKFLYSNILNVFKDGNLWLEGFYSSNAMSALSTDYQSVPQNILRRSNISNVEDKKGPGMLDTLLEVKIIDSFLNKCYFSFVNVVCDDIPHLYAERITGVLLELITGFVEAEILPKMCKKYDYKKKNSEKRL